nr:heparinase II/III family protein [Candidatus Sigynarchaeota archaeon]
YGVLSFNATAREARFDQSGTDMRLRFAGSDTRITNHSNYAYNYGTKEPVEYIKVRPLDPAACRIVTVITFGNATIPHPAVDIQENATSIAITVNGTDRFLFHAASLQGFNEPLNLGSISFAGNFCGFRMNASNAVEWMVLDEATAAEYTGPGDQWVFDPQALVSGFINTSTGTFDPSGQGQGDPAPAEMSTPFNTSLLAGRPHPYLLFDDADLDNLRNKCNGSIPGPWQSWYADTGSGWFLHDAFKGRIESNQAWIDYAIHGLLGIDDILFDWAHEQFISRSTMLFPYLFTYDMIYNNMSVANRTVIEQKLVPKLLDLADAAQSDAEYSNNHRVVATVALGVGGLLFNNATWVQLAQDMNDFYLANCVRPNGPCYEGDVYGRYTFENAIKFYIALRRAGGYEYFTNPRFLKYLNYTATSVSPLGWTPVFEDCSVKSNLAAMASIAAYPANATSPSIARNLQWYVDFCGEPGYDFVYRIATYAAVTAPQRPVVGANGGFAYFDSGLALARSGWDHDSTYLVMSNKYYYQSHVHLDENSIEVYALGKKFLTNPGYPGYGDPGHDYTLSTEASNTALLNGQGQLNVISDGFSNVIQNQAIDYIVSPAHKAYKSPFRIAVNFGFLVLIGGIAASLAVAGAIAFHLHVKRRRNNEESRATVSEAKAGERMGSVSGVKTLFKFDAATLSGQDYRAKSMAVFPVVFLALISSPGIIYFMIRLADYTAFNIRYLEMNPNLVAALTALAPAVKVAVFVLVPLVNFLAIGMFMGIHTISLYLLARSNGIEGVSFAEARGITAKVWLLQSPVMAAGIAGNILFLTQRFLVALHHAQVDAYNSIRIGIFLEELLSDAMVYLLILGAASLAMHYLARMVLDKYAASTGYDARALRASYYIGLLVTMAIFMAVALVASMAMFGVFDSIAIENNPLQ